eukprot:scaffold32576_cov26-Tisochrysis_lutea.AAC.1
MARHEYALHRKSRQQAEGFGEGAARECLVRSVQLGCRLLDERAPKLAPCWLQVGNHLQRVDGKDVVDENSMPLSRQTQPDLVGAGTVELARQHDPAYILGLLRECRQGAHKPAVSD